MSRTLLLAALAALAAGTIVAPAPAQDAAKPTTSCYGLFFRDKAGDAVRGHPAFAGEQGQDNLDLIDGFFAYDASKGDEAASVAIHVKNLDKTVPEGSTSIQWQAEWTGSSGALTWVRAVTDFSGLVTYDYGGQQDGGVTTFNVRQGGTTGNFFEGPDGIVQIVIPPTVEPKGTQLKGITVYGYEPVQAIPGAAPTPVKGGQLYEQDTASGGRYVWTVGGECPPAAADPDAVDPQPSPAKPVQVDEKLPVRVLTKSAKRGKRVAVRLRSSEAITKVAAQLKKGRKVYAKGSLARLDGTATLRLKTSRRLKRGTYVLDVAGTDSSGARRFAAARLKVR